jgi:hypothetical protein
VGIAVLLCTDIAQRQQRRIEEQQTTEEEEEGAKPRQPGADL